jgi:hypothetical protein
MGNGMITIAQFAVEATGRPEKVAAPLQEKKIVDSASVNFLSQRAFRDPCPVE